MFSSIVGVGISFDVRKQKQIFDTYVSIILGTSKIFFALYQMHFKSVSDWKIEIAGGRNK